MNPNEITLYVIAAIFLSIDLLILIVTIINIIKYKKAKKENK